MWTWQAQEGAPKDARATAESRNRSRITRQNGVSVQEAKQSEQSDAGLTWAAVWPTKGADGVASEVDYCRHQSD